MQQSVSMQYTLRDLMLVFVLLASALGAFGPWGIAVAVILLGIVIAIIKEHALICVILSFGLLMGFLIPAAVIEHQNYDLRSVCSNNLKQIVHRLNTSPNNENIIPSAYSVDDEGKPAISWRNWTFLYDGFLCPSYLNKSWNDPSNKELTETNVYEFICPSNLSEQKKALTNYVVVTGPHTLWPGSTPGILNDIPDGAKNTILIIELPHSDILWSEPRDLTFEQICKEIDSDPELKMFAAHEIDRGFFSLPDKGANVAFADGSVRCLSTVFLQKYLKAMLTRDGSEKIDFDDLPYPRPNWPRIVALIVLVLSVIALLRRPGKNNLSNTAVLEQSQTIT